MMITDRQVTNVIAIKIVAGEAGLVLKVAGPLDLLGVVRRLQFSRRVFEEDFDGSSLPCSGKRHLRRLLHGSDESGRRTSRHPRHRTASSADCLRMVLLLTIGGAIVGWMAQRA